MTEPSYDAQIERRDFLIGRIEALQSELTGLRHAALNSDPLRAELTRELAASRAGLRAVKSWLQKNNPQRTSEWRVLARCYQALLRLLDAEEDGRASLGDATLGLARLVTDIEALVPPEHLSKTDPERQP